VTSSRRFVAKKQQQRKLQAVRKLARQQSGQTIAIHPDKAGDNSPGEPS
jgi:hypothetical protein